MQRLLGSDSDTLDVVPIIYELPDQTFKYEDESFECVTEKCQLLNPVKKLK